MTHKMLRAFGLLSAALLLPLSPARAQDVPVPPDDKDRASQDDIVVTGTMRVRQGGAQNISHFRSISAEIGMPRPEGLKAEGLLGEHDLVLPSAGNCAQLFCVVAEAMPANLPLRPADKLFVGLGFASNIDAASWRRAPLDLVAVVDKSGSMSGQPLALVRASLRKIVGQMRDGDRMSIVLYGDRSYVHLAPTDYAGHRADLLRAIDAIASAGSTDMESGLRVGYDTAFAEAPRFKGNTRVMLFTDEQPNVGATDAESFIGMAEEASRRGIGLTTIGVGVQFDDTLATHVSSVRGGNLYFIANEDEVKSTFENQLDTMVSMLANDLELTLRPAAGYRISGVFGVPDDVMTQAPEGAITVKIPTVFLSTNGGGIFATLAKDSSSANLPAPPIAGTLMDVSLTYNLVSDGRAEKDQLTVAGPSGTPSMPMRQAALLVDQYLAMREASAAYHERGDPKAAFALLNGLSARMRAANLPGMAKEEKLASEMLSQAAFYSGYGGELRGGAKPLAIVGTWEVTYAEGFSDLKRGDRLEFTPEREMLTYRARHGSFDQDDSEMFEINENEMHWTSSNLVLRYAARGDSMRLDVDDMDGQAALGLRRVN